MTFNSILAIQRRLSEVTIHAMQLPQSYRGLCLAAGFMLVAFTAPAYAETCRKQIVNGQEVTICCDGNGVCYNK